MALTCSVPQGSVFGLKEFVVYTEDIVETIEKFAVNHHLYADDSQLLTHVRLETVAEHRCRLELCVEHLGDWCSSRRLPLDPDKTELMWFGSRSNRTKRSQLDASLNLGSVVIEPVHSVRDLGVILDGELSMIQHIGQISSICFFHLRRLRKPRLVLDPSSMQRLISTFIMSRLDYCNAMLAGLPACTLAPLQRVLNAAARLMVGPTAEDRISDVMRSLHWMPIEYRIRYKLCLLMHAVQNGTSPAYIVDIKTPISSLHGHRMLRSAATYQYEIPRTRTKFDDRAFSVAGPQEWNNLPTNIRNIREVSSFKRAIKDILFKMTYSD